MGAVGFGVQEGVGFGGVRRSDLEDPAFGEGVGVDETGVAIQGFINRDDFSGDGSVDVAGGFDGFNNGYRIAGADFAADGGEVNEDDVGEFGLGVVGDADGGGGFAGLNPFVGGAVAEMVQDS